MYDIPLRVKAPGAYTQAGWLINNDIESEVAVLQARGVVFEEYDTPDLKTVKSIATIGPDKVAWFKESEGNLLVLIQVQGNCISCSKKEKTMSTFTLLAPTTQAALLADLEELWQRFDEVVGILGPDDWSGKHGQHWTFPDVPYHLAYFDREVIVTAIERGTNVPTSEQFLRTEAEQDAWNEIKFTQRPTTMNPEQCLEQMWASRQAIRNAVSRLSEADLERPVFLPLVGLGWVSMRVALETCYAHTWNHLMQLRFWMKCTTLIPGPAQTHRALSYFMATFARNMNREQAAQTHLTAVLEFSDLEGGVWTLHVAGGSCQIIEGRAARAELVIVQSPETFVKTRTGIQNPRLALWTGKIQVQGLRHLGTFEKLFPITSLDFVPATPAKRET